MDYKEKLIALLNDKDLPQEQKEKMEQIFPELADSEDERIGKVLVDYFNRYKEQEECGIKTFYGIPTDNIIAWLEKKQGEKNKWSNEDEMIVLSIKQIVTCASFLNIVPEKLDRIDKWLKSLKQRIKK